MQNEKIKKLIAEGLRDEALLLLQTELKTNPNSEELLMDEGELLYGQGKMTEALNSFNAIQRQNPENKKAANYAIMINNILGYYCKDMLNP